MGGMPPRERIIETMTQRQMAPMQPPTPTMGAVQPSGMMMPPPLMPTGKDPLKSPLADKLPQQTMRFGI